MRYIQEPSDAQAAWCGAKDPRGKLIIGEVYEVTYLQQKAWYTGFWLRDVIGLTDRGGPYNSVSFESAVAP